MREPSIFPPTLSQKARKDGAPTAWLGIDGAPGGKKLFTTEGTKDTEKNQGPLMTLILGST